MRVIFIHGFGENESIFSKVVPFIPGGHTFLNVWELLGDKPLPGINVLVFAQSLVEKYDITQHDVIIGHSMGGWIAWHIKHFTGSPVVQIASWTDPDRPIKPLKNVKIIYWLVRNGLFFNRFLKRLFTAKGYKGKPSKQIYEEIFDRLIAGNKENIINQLRLILTPVPERVTVHPDLRIHARADLVVRPPREPYDEVIGDHFTLYTYPEAVYKPIVAFLNHLQKK
ncbi:alpha/beta hydrolase [Mucilaginibacter gotjawali]|uniref:AB hydrolase-1 domain-containing protein n=2 Tax=Mucilaginibacter gotjawali TaxID=1550579 RepID=A0A0X8X2M2_9SPHI|nr:alpha/beta hydrolase [Mucilaginibacter gotjawali]MBB3057691.1 hypothetical protein [Mucilaginibacter gotjawali]BAU52494.1 hypothetical protein MgSA37_00655 [Mucilaginibacter gotjawali]